MLRFTHKVLQAPTLLAKNASTRLTVSRSAITLTQQRFTSKTIQHSHNHGNVADEHDHDYNNYPMLEKEGGMGDEFNDEYMDGWMPDYTGWEDEYYTGPPQQEIESTPGATTPKKGQ
jgi:hypothetical protein